MDALNRPGFKALKKFDFVDAQNDLSFHKV